MSVGPIGNQGVSTVIGTGGTTVTGGVGSTSGTALVQAAKILNGIAGDLFGKKGGTQKAEVKDRGALNSPLASLGKQLVQRYAPELKDLSAKDLSNQINVGRGGTTARPLGGTGTTRSAASAQVIPTAFADRGSLASVAQTVLSTGLQSLTNALDNLTSSGSSASSSSSAATGLGSLLSGIGSSSSAATGSSGGDFESGLLSKIQGPPPMPANVKDERQMLEYQRAMQLYTAMVQMVTQVMQMLHEARKNIIQNLRA